MFLRSLTIKGFKSFADKTTLEFTPGISVIVGPNGSGKSNVADAIAWVLGEQGPRALRGAQMADVVFAGSPGRPALGMAEVSMVIDNTAGLIPVPATEIEISRAIYRSGDSEYRLGGRPCRLMDIQELLSDTGVGRELHTLIGQGHLEDVLAARPEDRRVLIEEAAGIAKHRRRRERAERKLAGLEQDVLRLSDVVSELRRQLKPLKQQAELAARHEELSREADELARRLAAVRLRDLFGDRDRRSPAWREAEARQAEARTKLAALGEAIEGLDRERAAAEEAQRAAEEAHAQASRSRSEAEAAFRTALRREAEVRDRLTTAAGRSARLFALTDELERTERALDEVRGALEAREGELAEAERIFRRQEQTRHDAEQERRRQEAEAAARRAEAETVSRTLAGHEAERGRLEALLHDLTNRSRRTAVGSERLAEQIEGLDAQETPFATEQSALERERSELGHSIGELDAVEKGLLARQEVVDARMIELAESPGAAFARRRGDRPLGVLRDLISAPPDVRLALRGALGPLADAVVYASQEDAIRDAEEGNGGGVTLLSAGQGPAPDLLDTPGTERLLDRARPDQRVAALTARLLGATFLVANLAEASSRHRVHPDATFVTPEGMVVGPTFVRTPLGADARIEALRRDSAALERELSTVRRGLREKKQRTAEVTARLEEVHASLEGIDRQITAAAEELASMKAQTTSVSREASLVGERAAALDAAIEEARRRVPEAPDPMVEPPSLPPVPEAPVHLRVDVEALRRERSRLETGVSRTRREVEALAAEDPTILGERLQQAEADRSAVEERLKLAETALEEALAAYRESAEAARVAQAKDAEANRSWRELAALADSIRQDHEQEDRARLDLDRRIAEAERLLHEGYGVDPAGAAAALQPEDSVEMLQRQSDLVARRLGLLGRVNLLAVGELESIQERHDFLVRELDDVKAARRDLLRIIQEVDLQMAELFASAFQDTAREFASLFTTMFPGGEGRLTLTDPDDLLATGIEVEARPGGKRVKRLSLLSGGERSLAALSFLFAIFRARPSPFYLMDEVEAALDDVNLSRFLEVLKGFAEASQILIVTHQKRTMEVGDVLYGISMGKDGSSTVLSQRLAEVGAH